jgi:hypothetical protein
MLTVNVAKRKHGIRLQTLVATMGLRSSKGKIPSAKGASAKGLPPCGAGAGRRAAKEEFKMS